MTSQNRKQILEKAIMRLTKEQKYYKNEIEKQESEYTSMMNQKDNDEDHIYKLRNLRQAIDEGKNALIECERKIEEYGNELNGMKD